MTRKITTLLLVFLTLNFYAAAQTVNNYTKLFDAAKMKNRVRELSSDRYNGRSPSDKLAAEYIAGELKKIGAKPANKGSYFQNVKLFGTKSNSNTKLSVGDETFNFGDDWVGFTDAQKPEVSIDAEIVFVGYGIDAPLYNWNDYKGNAGRLSRQSFDDVSQRSARDNGRTESFRRTCTDLLRALDIQI